MNAMKVPALVFSDRYVRERVMAIADRISDETGVTVQAILGRDRLKTVARARAQLMLALWRDEGLSLAEVGAVLGLHHTTVMYGVRKCVGEEAYRTEVLARYQPSRLGSYRGKVRVA